MFHVEGVSKMEEGAATQPFLASLREFGISRG